MGLEVDKAGEGDRVSDTSANQTPDRDPETVALFVEESLEALVRVEGLLLAAEEGDEPKDFLATLFRDVHTIKGTSGFLAFKRVLSIAHAAEDLLARLREGSLVGRPEHFARLVAVVDVLRRLVEAVRDTGDEAAIDVAELAAQLRADAGGPAPQKATAPTPAADPLPAAAPVAAATAPPKGEPEPAHAERAEASDGTVRVHVGVLDRFMNLMGELVLARNQMVQLIRANRDGNVAGQAACQRLSVVTSELQEQIMKARMQPVARVFEKIPRMVRDLCQITGKKVTTQIEGNATEIDKALVEAVRDPVMHIVRNAVDHGIEPSEERVARGKPPAGKLSVRAAHVGGMVAIEIEDDGRGMDPRFLRAHAVKKGLLSAAEAERLSDRDALDLVFRAGFTTAAKVTDISGRGVGMDVVRTHVDRAGGQVELESTPGKGTILRLKMPLTLAIIPALLVSTCGQRFAIPQVNLLELVYLNDEQVKTQVEYVRGAAVYRLRGEILPLVRLDKVLGLDRPAKPEAGVNIVVVAIGPRRYGLVVEEIHDTEEIVIKPLHSQLKRLACYSGATVLGDGVALILEVAGVAAMSGIDVSMRQAAPKAEGPESAAQPPQSFLVFTAGNGQPCAVPLAMVARLEQVDPATIERVAGTEVLQYRKSIMPIVRPDALLPLGRSEKVRAEQQIVVFDFGHPVGMAVESILDVAELVVDPEASRGAAPLTLGKVVAFGKTTLLLDVYAIVRQVAPGCVQEQRRGEAQRRPRLLLADDSNAMRSAIAGFLRSSGFDVVDTATGEGALRELRAQHPGHFDCVVTDLEMEGVDGFAVLDAVKRERPLVPAVVWTYHDEPEIKDKALQAGARACLNKLDREELLSFLRTVGLGPKKARERVGAS
jgi:two-component system chemotaxis sensor kinase CheA